MSQLRPIQGSELIRILCNHFGFIKVRQKGSHVTLYRERDKTHVTVPVGDIQIGLLNRILKDCAISREGFFKHR